MKTLEVRYADYQTVVGYKSRYPELQALGMKVLPFEYHFVFYTVNKAYEIVNIIRSLRGSVNYRNLF